ncbi:MAG: IPT/TIG domain-containing protein [Planctomycetota bacterium]|jgi:hypothetical protein
MRILTAFLLLATTALAQSITSVTPECAAPGDYVLIRGSDFAAEPTVTFGTVPADVVRSHDTKILVRVPEGVAAGPLTLDVDGATASFTVLEAGAPLVLHLSAAKATPGMFLIVIGARLQGGTAEFVADDGEVLGTAALVGGRRAAFLRVPSDLPVGTYTLVITNAEGLDSGACSPAIEIVEPGTPTLEDIQPEGQTPGQPVLCEGHDLGPLGFCLVQWTDSQATTLYTLGFANGFDRVYTRVPFRARGGETYDVVIEFSDGGTTEEGGAFAYEVGTPPPPELVALEYDSGPAGDFLGLRGHHLFAGFELPTVEFTRDGVATEALVLHAFPGFGKHADEVGVQIPKDLADGDYDVTVTTSAGTSNALVFTVVDLPLTVTSMQPDHQGPRGPNSPVLIKGTGFGVFDPLFGLPGLPEIDPDLAVTWDDGSGAASRRGLVLFHTNREIFVIPPGGWFDPLPAGEYTVRVVLHPDSDEPEIAVAGTYTVH